MTLSIKKKLNKKRTEKKVKITGQNEGKARKFFSKISGAFMLPISVMAIAGIFLGVGSTIVVRSTEDSAIYVFGNFIKMLGEPIFGAMPILFAAAIVIAFTEEAGVAVFAAIIGFLIFNSLQSVFIRDITKDVIDKEGFKIKEIIGYEILFGGPWRDSASLLKLVGNNLGIKSLQTAIFGGIIVGAITAWLYNRYHTIQLPQVISFFGGKRFVSLLVILAMIPLSFIFLIIWPYIGYALSVFGNSLGQVPYGFESFIFGFIERSLIPFGLHHVFYAPLWYTSAGGDGISALQKWMEQAGNWDQNSGNIQELLNWLKDKKDLASGDSFLWQRVASFKYDTITWYSGGKEYNLKIFDFFAKELNIKLGRFMQGKYPFMIFALPAAGAAMIFAAPKENRKIAMGTVLPAAFTAALTGITEPIEFTFLFLAPWLYWGFHATMAAISFMTMNVLGAHMGMTFSGGILDLIIYGAIPISKGTYFYWTAAIGPVFAVIYFFVFLFVIKKFNLQTPGRGDNVRLYSKADYLKDKDAKKETGASKMDSQLSSIVLAFGGWDNITSFNNCASRLRYDVVDSKKVDVEALKQAGAFGVQKIGEKHFQVIFGPASEQINSRIVASKGQPLMQSKNILKSSKKNKENAVIVASVKVNSVVDGKVASLQSLKDGVFSEKMMGDGVVIEPTINKNTKFYAPISGTMTTVFPTGHAYGIQDENGVSILIHIGLDTVNLKGQGFKSLVKQGQKVKQGDPIAKVDLQFVKKNAPSVATIVVLTPDSTGEITNILQKGSVTKKSTIFNVGI